MVSNTNRRDHAALGPYLQSSQSPSNDFESIRTQSKLMGCQTHFKRGNGDYEIRSKPRVSFGLAPMNETTGDTPVFAELARGLKEIQHVSEIIQRQTPKEWLERLQYFILL